MTKEIKTWQSRFAEARATLKAQGGDITPEKSASFRCQALMEENEALRNAMHEVYDLGIEWSEKTTEPGLDIDALEALALAVSPGHSWRVQRPNAGSRGWEVAGPDGMDQIAADLTEKRAAYVAAANPSTVLELINRLRIAEQTMIEKADAAFKEPAPKAPALPPIDPECGIYSIDVLAMENPRNITIGYYDFKVKQWNDGDGRIDVLEWWPLPISGTGTPVPEVAP